MLFVVSHLAYRRLKFSANVAANDRLENKGFENDNSFEDILFTPSAIQTVLLEFN